ncbi:type VI secretion system tip protein VgrG [Myxococcus stipitatus]|uniref:type VI secretion system Vgr family protein n=1 Tax=Myxococcus stipitatus TaxID=83455 RepID=UPI00314513B8
MLASVPLPQLPADFEFQAGPHALGALTVVGFEAEESLSKPYAVDVTLTAPALLPLDEKELLGKDALLTVHQGGNSPRWFQGVVSSVVRWESPKEPERQFCRMTVVPRLWTLRHKRRSRIFQEMSVPDIVRKVLGEASVDHRLALQGTYRKREYCVQYRESDLDFVSRLLEEEGIFYFFEHTPDAHTLCLCDAADSCERIPGAPQLPFREPSEQEPDTESIHEFAARTEVQPGAVALRDFNFLRPGMNLTATSSVEGGEGALEVYDYPARYEETGTGNALARIRLEELRVRTQMGKGAGNSRRLLPGMHFDLDEYPVDSLNRSYFLLSVRHVGRQQQVLTFGETVPEKTVPYRNEFLCIPSDVPYRPRRLTPRPTLSGAQTAIVVGPPNEEIHTDEHGRIKVQFHWDREGRRDDRSSCWIRVGQAWAGPGWGALYLPRIGHEVVVEFIEGDPDRPIVTGSVYNGQNATPIALPDHKTQSTLRSSSSPGEDGFNELRFEDSAGDEQVFLHAQRDFNIVVENDKTQQVGGNETLLVKKDRSRTIQGNQKLEVKKNDDSVIGGNQSLTVVQNRATEVLGNHTEAVTGDQTLHVTGNQSVTVAKNASETVGQTKVVQVRASSSVTVGAALKQVIGGQMSEQVSGAKTETVGGKKAETIQGARTLQVGGSLTEQVDSQRTLKVEKDLLVSVGGRFNHSTKESYTLSAKEISLVADEQFTLKVGSALFQVKKNGDVVIKGAKVELTASGDVIIKGSTISEN